MSQAIFWEYSRFELLKVTDIRCASNFIRLHCLSESICVVWRQADSKQGTMVHKLCIDEYWWSKIDFLTFCSNSHPCMWDALSADMYKLLLEEVYNGMNTMVEKIVEIISQISSSFICWWSFHWLCEEKSILKEFKSVVEEAWEILSRWELGKLRWLYLKLSRISKKKASLAHMHMKNSKTQIVEVQEYFFKDQIPPYHSLVTLLVHAENGLPMMCDIEENVSKLRQ